ncbi:uncharacterized protein LOC131534496 isoform X2 [Onychostoma macrolepis]|uniref:uncharacterized protein LOC131534496 isoform X2 n=1 Tax=Onychostoma macrolepis TaxID=369639 RepID=UPI00272997AE|nr:uncharacterized protein LOC131534496 isoform X2 [Onychostoma macrolepis]
MFLRQHLSAVPGKDAAVDSVTRVPARFNEERASVWFVGLSDASLDMDQGHVPCQLWMKSGPNRRTQLQSDSLYKAVKDASASCERRPETSTWSWGDFVQGSMHIFTGNGLKGFRYKTVNIYEMVAAAILCCAWPQRVSGRVHLDPQPTPAQRQAENLLDLPFGSTDLRLTRSRAVRTGDSGVKLLRSGTGANCSQKASENISDLHEETSGVSGKCKLACVRASNAEKSEGWLRGEGKTQKKRIVKEEVGGVYSSLPDAPQAFESRSHVSW